MTPLTLVVGADAQAREAAIAAALQPGLNSVVILEGLPAPASPLALNPDPASPLLQVHRIAPGCPCCSGKLVMQVTLNRVLRHPPARLYLGLASSDHLQQVRELLENAPYNQIIRLSEVVQL